MTRRQRLPALRRRAALLAALLGAVWLSGCASPAPRESADAETPTDAYTRLGMAYLERNNLPRAMNALDRALEADPDDAEALQAMAMIYQRQGEDRLAVDFFERALKADPDFTPARNNYAAYLYDRGRVEAACAQLERASQDTQYPNRAQLFTNLGQCRQELGDIEAARAGFERAQSIDPRAPRSYLLLARLEHAQGNQSLAREQLDAFMRLAGTTPASRRLASDIAGASGAAAPQEEPRGARQ